MIPAGPCNVDHDRCCLPSPSFYCAMSSLLWITLSVLLLDYHQQSRTRATKKDRKAMTFLSPDVIDWRFADDRDHHQQDHSNSVAVLTVLLWLTASLQGQQPYQSSLQTAATLSPSFWASLVFAGTIASDLFRCSSPFRTRRRSTQRSASPPILTATHPPYPEIQTRFGYCSCCRSTSASMMESVAWSTTTDGCWLSSILNLVFVAALQWLAPSAWLVLLALELQAVRESGSSSSHVAEGWEPALLWCGSWTTATALHVYRLLPSPTVASPPFDGGPRPCFDDAQWKTWSTEQLVEWIACNYCMCTGGSDATLRASDAAHPDREELQLILDALASERIRGDQLPDCAVGRPLLAGVLPSGALHRLQRVVHDRLLGPFPPLDQWNCPAPTWGPSQHDLEYYHPKVCVSKDQVQSNDGDGHKEVPGATSDHRKDVVRIPLSDLPRGQSSLWQGDANLLQVLERMAQPMDMKSSQVPPDEATHQHSTPPSIDHNYLMSLSSSSTTVPPFIREIVQTRPDLVKQALKLHRRRRVAQEPSATLIAPLSHCEATAESSAVPDALGHNPRVDLSSSSNSVFGSQVGLNDHSLEINDDSCPESLCDGEMTALLSKTYQASDATLYKSIL